MNKTKTRIFIQFRQHIKKVWQKEKKLWNTQQSPWNSSSIALKTQMNSSCRAIVVFHSKKPLVVTPHKTFLLLPQKWVKFILTAKTGLCNLHPNSIVVIWIGNSTCSDCAFFSPTKQMILIKIWQNKRKCRPNRKEINFSFMRKCGRRFFFEKNHFYSQP